MEITVKFSSLIRMMTRLDHDLVNVDEGTTIDQLTRILDQKYKNLRFSREKTKYLVNNKFVNGDRVLAEGDEVSIYQTLRGN
ncbi:MAG: MoaD/ThiS family protein [Deltaproteobacteria bacterium]|nr:MoaD/ThiS family protein [Deltaproteobacteria bacterium]